MFRAACISGTTFYDILKENVSFLTIKKVESNLKSLLLLKENYQSIQSKVRYKIVGKESSFEFSKE